MQKRQSASFWLIIAAAALCTQSCSTSRLPAGGKLIYGAAPLPGDLAGDPAPAGPAAPLTPARVIRSFMEVAKDDLWPCLTKERRDILSDAQFVIVTKNSAAFLMFTTIVALGEGKFDRRIHISETTWRNFFNIAMARRLQEENIGIDIEWVTRYMLYMRSTKDRDRAVTPMAATGLSAANRGGSPILSPERQSKVIEDVVAEAHSRATFLVAHEFYHVLKPLLPRAGESKAEYERRQMPDEQDADNFAMDMMFCRVFIKKHLKDIGVAPRLFTDWMLLMEGSRHKLVPGTHPFDHVRARNATQYAIDKISMIEQTPDRVELIGELQKLVALTEAIDKEGPAQYFAKIDEEAREEGKLELLKLPKTAP